MNNTLQLLLHIIWLFLVQNNLSHSLTDPIISDLSESCCDLS